MDIIISSNTNMPIYEQITSQIKAMIMSGTLNTGDPIPSMRALAKSLHVSVITVQKAYEDLQRDGFIETTVGRGSFVSARNRDFYQEEQQRRAEAHLEEAAGIGRQSGIPLEKLVELLTLFYQEGPDDGNGTDGAGALQGISPLSAGGRILERTARHGRGADRRKRRGQEHADQRGPGPGEKGCGRGKRAGKRDAGRGNARAGGRGI